MKKDKQVWKVGQVWIDKDKRNSYPGGIRSVRITELDSYYVYIHCLQSGRNSRVSRSRFEKGFIREIL